jgi:ABC-type sugar transport system substrate-binding protein
MTFGVIVPSEGLLVRDVFEQTIRHEASLDSVLCEVVHAKPGAEPEEIRAMAKQGYSTIIIVPEPGQEEAVAATVREVHGEGVPMVVLDLSGRTKVEGVPLVTMTPHEESAKALVAAAVEDARKAGFPAHAPAVVLVNGPHDQHGRERLAALHKALEEAGVPTLPDIVFSGYTNTARDTLGATLKDHPEVAIVLTTDEQSTNGAAQFREAMDKEKPRFVHGGFFHDRDTLRMASYNLLAGMVDDNYEALGRRAFRVAKALSEGKSEGDHVVVETKFHRAAGPERRGYFPPAEMFAPKGARSSTAE